MPPRSRAARRTEEEKDRNSGPAPRAMEPSAARASADPEGGATRDAERAQIAHAQHGPGERQRPRLLQGELLAEHGNAEQSGAADHCGPQRQVPVEMQVPLKLQLPTELQSLSRETTTTAPERRGVAERNSTGERKPPPRTRLWRPLTTAYAVAALVEANSEWGGGAARGGERVPCAGAQVHDVSDVKCWRTGTRRG